ncbi:hypothetical protein JJB98_12275 [Bradyrhizobium diazoefficiens]|nr:hypothetical protein [Bradyrhizobium diazoefficiens]QQO20629.1 hypothetical protein JJB98_12275 [Bradyrhizobium diazoefficiens]
MTTAARLLARRQDLFDRLRQDPGPHEREEIERLVAKIDTALELLKDTGQGDTADSE